ncbi:acyl-CoA carboxylase subunit epsilon [Arthrobacter roseus]|uniref:acyl-CoA carboxylase subunit epsilon n=1 Tax=Arthrobacter roseus TaxID=136274 RepID=UPI001963FB1A|nr:acyl-CoA carboxylase subunit epsilon [Arthrobacter roseus]MBM7848065.1 hypothetical protein [Arthrobacter roseus]
MTTLEDDGDRPEPLLQVVSGHPTPEELAALTAVVAGLGSVPEDSTPAGNPRTWGRRELARRRLSPGRGAWKRGAH